MTVHKGFASKGSARTYASRMRQNGFKASVYRTDHGDWRVSVTRGK